MKVFGWTYFEQAARFFRTFGLIGLYDFRSRNVSFLRGILWYNLLPMFFTVVYHLAHIPHTTDDQSINSFFSAFLLISNIVFFNRTLVVVANSIHTGSGILDKLPINPLIYTGGLTTSYLASQCISSFVINFCRYRQFSSEWIYTGIRILLVLFLLSCLSVFFGYLFGVVQIFINDLKNILPLLLYFNFIPMNYITQNSNFENLSPLLYYSPAVVANRIVVANSSQVLIAFLTMVLYVTVFGLFVMLLHKIFWPRFVVKI